MESPLIDSKKSSPCRIEISLAKTGEILRTLSFDQDSITIGRDDKCDIRIDNLGVSRVHAEIKRDGNIYRIFDQKSKTGLFIRGKRVQECNLSSGDEIFLAKHIIAFFFTKRMRTSNVTKRLEKTGQKKALEESKEKALEEAKEKKPMMQTMEVDFTGMASEHTPAPAQLHVAGTSKRIPLHKNAISFGKSKSCDITISGLFVAQKHAVIVQDRKGFVIRFLGRFYPPRVNDQKIKKTALLKDGDFVQIGSIRFVFQVNFG